MTSEAGPRARLEDDAGSGDALGSPALDTGDPGAEPTGAWAGAAGVDPADDGRPAREDAELDTGEDAEFDTGEDAGFETGVDDGLDAGVDAGDDDARSRGGARLSIPLVPTLSVLLVLLLGGVAYLWFTRPATSSVRTGDYVQVLEAARSEVVDLTSFDYQTLDDDITQARKITVGDLRTESVAQLTNNRQQLTDQQAVVNTQVVGAGVTRADDTHGTVLLVIQSTQQTKASQKPTIVRYRIQADLTKTNGRWLLSGITGR